MTGMFSSLAAMLDGSQFLPHGVCLDGRPSLIWLHAVSDGLTALAYYSIPFALLVFAWRRRDLRWRWMFVLFGAFILACGTTHALGVWTLWEPVYVVQGLAKAATAIISLTTAVLLWPMLPKALALPGPGQWQAVNRALGDEVRERRAAEEQVRRMNAELEKRVRERTAELERANRALTAEVAQRVAVEAQLRAAKAEAEQASVAKSRFLAAASHDLRQPVQALFLFAEAIAHRLRNRPEAAVMGDFRRSLDALKALLDSILDVSKLDAGVILPERQRFPVNDMLRRMASEYGVTAKAKGVELRVVPCSAEIDSDPALLGRVVQNLVHNAVRYTPSGRILVGCRRRPGGVRLEVHDTGMGIPEQHLSDIFDEFFQVGNQERDREKGLGLGLAIVRRLVRLLGHHLQVRSREGKGTMFSLELPLAADRPPAPAD